MRIKIQQVGIYETLVAQLDRIFRHNRQGSFHTRRRYYEAMKRFCTLHGRRRLERDCLLLTLNRYACFGGSSAA